MIWPPQQINEPNKHKNPEDKEIIRGNQIPFVSFDAFNRILTKNEFKKYFEPIYLAGQNEKIHSYKCNFTVDIFDYTNKSNKQGYKNSRKFVERYFYKFEENSSWPH